MLVSIIFPIVAPACESAASAALSSSTWIFRCAHFNSLSSCTIRSWGSETLIGKFYTTRRGFSLPAFSSCCTALPANVCRCFAHYARGKKCFRAACSNECRRYAAAARPIQFLRGRACVRSMPFTSIASSSGRIRTLRAPLAAGQPNRPRSSRLPHTHSPLPS